MLDGKTVDHVAALARIELSGTEKRQYAEQLSKILDFAADLNKLDTSNVEPTAHIMPLENVYRADEEGEHMPNTEIFRNSPDKQAGFFRVARTI